VGPWTLAELFFLKKAIGYVRTPGDAFRGEFRGVFPGFPHELLEIPPLAHAWGPPVPPARMAKVQGHGMPYPDNENLCPARNGRGDEGDRC
jgi:hypothetical protein